MKEIQLTQGYTALVDDEDFERVSAFKWYAVVNANTVYAQRKVAGEDSKQHNLYLHRYLLGTASSEIDHRDHNGLNCQKGNLRVADNFQNVRNQQKTRGSSQYKGVYWHKATEKWMAKIQVDGRTKFLGRFSSETEAALAYDIAAHNFFGEFAAPNFARVAQSAQQ